MTKTNSPQHWVIGDLQGCLQSLDHLLAQPALHENSQTHFIFAGDLINRGPDNLGVLQRLHELGDRAQCVLGNHDIHFLSVAAGARRANRYDTFSDILDSPDKDFWIDWLRHQPLMLEAADHLIVHAGVSPQWQIDELRQIARDIEADMQGRDWKEQINTHFGNELANWSPNLQGDDRLRDDINV